MHNNDSTFQLGVFIRQEGKVPAWEKDLIIHFDIFHDQALG